jgi:hypothetical protein
VVEQCRACGLLAEMTQPTQLGRARVLGELRTPVDVTCTTSPTRCATGLAARIEINARLQSSRASKTQLLMQMNNITSVYHFLLTIGRLPNLPLPSCPTTYSTKQWVIAANPQPFRSGPWTALSYICAVVMTYQIHTNKYFPKSQLRV